MKIVMNLDILMASRRSSLGELAGRLGITMANLSILKNNKAKAIRFSTLDDYAVMSMVERGLGVSILPQLILKFLTAAMLRAIIHGAAMGVGSFSAASALMAVTRVCMLLIGTGSVSPILYSCLRRIPNTTEKDCIVITFRNLPRPLLV